MQDRQLSPIEIAIRSLRAAYAAARVAYRISPERFERVRAVFSQYEGNHNFHNYTIKKAARDPSAKRHIKSFVVDETPIIINGTEWLSLKVHGQSFMMHQIRKMVSMAAFVVRCGTPTTIIEESFRHEKLSIPKAPGLGLLLERPVFESYNNVIRLRGSVERESIDFGKYQKEIDEFKQKQIYEHIFREEERWAIFHQLIALLDNMRNSQLFYLSSLGIPAIKRMEGEDVKQSVEVVDGDSEGEEGTNGKEEG